MAWKRKAATISARLRSCVSGVLLQREFFIGNLLVRIHCIIVVIRWTGLALHTADFKEVFHC